MEGCQKEKHGQDSQHDQLATEKREHGLACEAVKVQSPQELEFRRSSFTVEGADPFHRRQKLAAPPNSSAPRRSDLKHIRVEVRVSRFRSIMIRALGPARPRFVHRAARTNRHETRRDSGNLVDEVAPILANNG